MKAKTEKEKKSVAERGADKTGERMRLLMRLNKSGLASERDRL